MEESNAGTLACSSLAAASALNGAIRQQVSSFNDPTVVHWAVSGSIFSRVLSQLSVLVGQNLAQYRLSVLWSQVMDWR